MRACAGAVVALISIAWPAPAEAELRLAVKGRGALRRALVDELSARGFEIDGGARAHASIAGGPTLVVTATDELGRTAERTVQSLEDAAAWIESWVRSDLLSALLPRPVIQAPPPPTRRPLRPLRGTDVRAVRADRELSPTAEGRSRRLCPTQLSSRAEATYGGERMYGGATMGAATVLGAPCVGLQARVGATQLAIVEGDVGRRMLGELLIQAGWPLRLGPLDLMPQLGIGPGVQHSSRKALSRTDPVLMIEVALNAALPLSDRAALELAFSGSVPLLAEHDPLYPTGSATGPNPGEAGFEKFAATALEGAPRWLLRLGVGLRVDVGSGP